MFEKDQFIVFLIVEETLDDQTIMLCDSEKVTDEIQYALISIMIVVLFKSAHLFQLEHQHKISDCTEKEYYCN